MRVPLWEKFVYLAPFAGVTGVPSAHWCRAANRKAGGSVRRVR
jgi:hypothetical protein